MIEYQNLKLESNTNYHSSKYINNLAILVSKHYNTNQTNILLTIKKYIKKSTNPVQLYQLIKTKI